MEFSFILAKQKLHIKYGYDKATYQYQRPVFLVSHKTIFRVFPIWVYVKWPLGQGHFWSQGYNLNNLGKGPLDKTKYQMSKAKAF